MKHILSIAVSRLAPNYTNWLTRLQPGVEITDFAGLDAHEFIRRAGSFSGLLLTGGGDVQPGLYGCIDRGGNCRNTDADRDKLEWQLIETAIRHDIPLLAVCRGLQMLNIVLGGTLITDIPALAANTILHKDKEDIYHPVTVVPGSQLHKITNGNSGMVNSSHHQAVDRLARGISVSAYSSDGMAEAIEYKFNPDSFCLGVQWHPERMDIDNPMSGLIGRAFLGTVTGDG